MKKRREAIANFIESVGGVVENHDLVAEIICTALKFAERPYDRGDLKIAHTTLKEMRYAFLLFSHYQKVRKVSVFGSARTVLTPDVYVQAETFGKAIVAAGFMVITGAGDGIMRAVQCGAGRKHSFGMNILLPFEQEANEFIESDPKLATFKYFFTRKLFFVKEANAIALFPGGFGTQDEGLEVLTLLQTGKSDPMPIVMIDTPDDDYWARWSREVAGGMLARKLIAEEDMCLFRVVNRVEDAVEEITRFYRNYHSLRYLNDHLVIRLNHPIGETAVARLNDLFSDIIVEGGIVASGPHPEESNEAHLSVLPRLTFHFNRKNFGRLRQLIDAINRVDPINPPVTPQGHL
jgi:uncharacterized protein (TIGR00730 family)